MDRPGRTAGRDGPVSTRSSGVGALQLSAIFRSCDGPAPHLGPGRRYGYSPATSGARAVPRRSRRSGGSRSRSRGCSGPPEPTPRQTPRPTCSDAWPIGGAQHRQYRRFGLERRLETAPIFEPKEVREQTQALTRAHLRRRRNNRTDRSHIGLRVWPKPPVLHIPETAVAGHCIRDSSMSHR